ncbi:MAG: hypothetical protein Q4D09_04765 [Clostridia bacterium]|nr:hypothetical protein [Clostridia bacterium]
MIGRVNTGGGKIKSVVGTFTSNKSAAQSSFSVTGLKFKPKVIFVRLLSSSNEAVHGEDYGSCFGTIDAAQMIDIDAGVAVYMSKRTDLNDYYGWGDMALSGITFANGTLTVKAGSAYSTICSDFQRHWTIGTYEYRIYGV